MQKGHTIMAFPKNFLWGASSSASQIEGGWNEGGRGLSVNDVQTPNPGTCSMHYASDFYHHFREDIALMAEMGLKAYRFSISWSRILPEGEGAVSEEGVAFYRAVFDELHK
jgi:6-phospho-beta-glucosidase